MRRTNLTKYWILGDKRDELNEGQQGHILCVSKNGEEGERAAGNGIFFTIRESGAVSETHS